MRLSKNLFSKNTITRFGRPTFTPGIATRAGIWLSTKEKIIARAMDKPKKAVLFAFTPIFSFRRD